MDAQRRAGRGDLGEAAVQDFVKSKLARYKWLEGGVLFVPAIPKSANGKILKNVLREEAKRGVPKSIKI